MKSNRQQISFYFLLLLMFHLNTKSQVGVNILTPHESAALHVQSPSGSWRGLLTPSMTSTNRLGINTGTLFPADGLIVYDTQHQMHYAYHAIINRWVSLSPFVLSTAVSFGQNFPSGAITTPSSTAIFSVGINKQNPSQALDVNGNFTVSGNTAVGGSLTVPGFPINALVPAGTIVMYNGNTAPSGWAICDGSSGTPDLRGRFIASAGQATTAAVAGDSNPNYALGSKGGENFHLLSKSEIPKHFHETNADGSTVSIVGGSHSHNVTPNGQVQGLSRAGGGSSGVAGDGSGTISTTTNSHSHPTTEFGGKVGNGTADGVNGQTHENRPQYYVLTFIMKMP